MNKKIKYADVLEILKTFQNEKKDQNYIDPDFLPNIDLYMDQVTTFMDAHLEKTKRNPEDKILTKTMINNYAKNQLLPPPVKKKYSKDHLLILTFIYYYKNILSINDIQTLLKPLTDQYFGDNASISMEHIYKEIFNNELDARTDLVDEMTQTYEACAQRFADSPAKDQDFLSVFAYVCALSFDIYTKKQMVERIIDHLTTFDEKEKSDKSEKLVKTEKTKKPVKK